MVGSSEKDGDERKGHRGANNCTLHCVHVCVCDGMSQCRVLLLLLFVASRMLFTANEGGYEKLSQDDGKRLPLSDARQKQEEERERGNGERRKRKKSSVRVKAKDVKSERKRVLFDHHSTIRRYTEKTVTIDRTVDAPVIWCFSSLSLSPSLRVSRGILFTRVSCLLLRTMLIAVAVDSHVTRLFL